MKLLTVIFLSFNTVAAFAETKCEKIASLIQNAYRVKQAETRDFYTDLKANASTESRDAVDEVVWQMVARDALDYSETAELAAQAKQICEE